MSSCGAGVLTLIYSDATSEAKTKEVFIVYKFTNNSTESQLIAVAMSEVASWCDLLEKKLRSVFHKKACDANSVSLVR